MGGQGRRMHALCSFEDERVFAAAIDMHPFPCKTVCFGMGTTFYGMPQLKCYSDFYIHRPFHVVASTVHSNSKRLTLRSFKLGDGLLSTPYNRTHDLFPSCTTPILGHKADTIATCTSHRQPQARVSHASDRKRDRYDTPLRTITGHANSIRIFIPPTMTKSGVPSLVHEPYNDMGILFCRIIISCTGGILFMPVDERGREQAGVSDREHVHTRRGSLLAAPREVK